MGEWSFLGELFEHLQAHSPMLGRFWLFIMLVFRILILGTVATDLFADEQEEFTCNTLQPGCKQVCYDMAFPISMYRFWVFHIILISTPALIYLLYAMHHLSKKSHLSSCKGSGGSGRSGRSGAAAQRGQRRQRGQRPQRGQRRGQRAGAAAGAAAAAGAGAVAAASGRGERSAA
ncbi:hypothetical protein NHX12_024754 [Muraenolepis orangiensis]|uniref:Connexin N-terminal domain-containing protein n=1 Tax=Muraenolepis orangiensis TaxID=630683 RepID=A0A9Q0EK14_9TELE|nr:hypothetical protein NHX12_024754 [Muraenolepis orangiensis]